MKYLIALLFLTSCASAPHVLKDPIGMTDEQFLAELDQACGGSCLELNDKQLATWFAPPKTHHQWVMK